MQRFFQCLEQSAFGVEFAGSFCTLCLADLVVEYSGHRVQVLMYADGGHGRTIGSEGSGNGQFSSPHGGTATDSDGRMVVADTHSHRVQVLV